MSIHDFGDYKKEATHFNISPELDGVEKGILEREIARGCWTIDQGNLKFNLHQIRSKGTTLNGFALTVGQILSINAFMDAKSLED